MARFNQTILAQDRRHNDTVPSGDFLSDKIGPFYSRGNHFGLFKSVRSSVHQRVGSSSSERIGLYC